jgi:methionyl-tRNA synthetase
MAKTYFLTTPIYYINDRPHIGHAYTTIVADVIARYQRLMGADVFFATGTDENSQKSVDAAQKAGATNIQQYIDEMAGVWEKTWRELDLTCTDFIRTTQPRHLAAVAEFFRRVEAKGDIYEGEYSGLYCTGCEAFYRTSDLNDAGECPLHRRVPETIREKNYFFRLTKYRDALLAHIAAHPEFIQPVSRRNEIVNYITNHLEDISISRQSQTWGIPVPGDPSQVLYVWFDALINYISVIGFGTDQALFEKFWPAQIQLVGKDIIKFHCALWPAMLMAADIAIPERVFAHGFFTIDGQKMSKSLGNVIDPVTTVQMYTKDALRYFLLREITFGEDGDFSLEKLKTRYNDALGNALGNLVSRVVVMHHKFSQGIIPEQSAAPSDFSATWQKYRDAMERFDFSAALHVIWDHVHNANRMITDEKPWELAKAGDARLSTVLYSLADTLMHVAYMLSPIMPDTSARILAQLGYSTPGPSWPAGIEQTHIAAGQHMGESQILFPRIGE